MPAATARRRTIPGALVLRAVVVNRLPGTGFLPPETGAQQGPGSDISAQRPEIGDHHTREMAAKTFSAGVLSVASFARPRTTSSPHMRHFGLTPRRIP